MTTVSVLVTMLAAPAAAQDVVYRVERRSAVPGQGDVFTLPVPPPPVPPSPPGVGGMLEHRIGMLAVEPFEGAEPVVGAPYSADTSTEVVQSLADGNRIEHRTTSSVARDGQGRVRREQQLMAIGGMLPQVDGRIVTIMDPVGRVHYSLDPARKVAMRLPLPVIKRTDGAAHAGVAVGALAAAPIGAQAFVMKAAPNDARIESLGTSQIEGVQAHGMRTVVTIPAGAVGNQAPIEMVSEQWYSQELGTIVLSRRSDPRFGETTYRLQNIVRAEPSPDLFQVPSDYTVEAVPAFGGARWIGKPPAP